MIFSSIIISLLEIFLFNENTVPMVFYQCFVLLFSGGRAESDCLPCPGGYYCDQDGQVAAAGQCSQGYYCPANATVISPTPSNYLCPVGYYCPTGSPDPVPCPAGLFQISSGQWTCDSCPAGSYCPSAIPPELIDCPPYNYCPNGTWLSMYMNQNLKISTQKHRQ